MTLSMSSADDMATAYNLADANGISHEFAIGLELAPYLPSPCLDAEAYLVSQDDAPAEKCEACGSVLGAHYVMLNHPLETSDGEGPVWVSDLVFCTADCAHAWLTNFIDPGE